MDWVLYDNGVRHERVNEFNWNYNIIKSSFNKIKLKYLIQVWEDVMKTENSKKWEKC